MKNKDIIFSKEEKNDMLECCIDALSNEMLTENFQALANNTPIIKAIYGIIKCCRGAKEYKFRKNTIRFLNTIKYNRDSCKDCEFKKNFENKLNNNIAFKNKVIEFTLLKLYDFNEELKVDIYSNIFSELYLNSLSWGSFNELVNALDGLFVYDIPIIIFICQKCEKDNGSKYIIKEDIFNNFKTTINTDSAIDRLLSIGIIKENENGITYEAIGNNNKNKITISNLGKQLIDYGKIEDLDLESIIF